MSYDLMVFNVQSAPSNKKDFHKWYDKQVEWNEDHSYDDPSVSSKELRNWFEEMMKEYPAMNGPFASDDVDDPKVTDYSVGRDVIYAAFAYSVAQEARNRMFELATKHKLGFFDISESGAIVTPGPDGVMYEIKEEPEKKPWWKFW